MLRSAFRASFSATVSVLLAAPLAAQAPVAPVAPVPSPDTPQAYPYVREEVRRLREQVQRQEKELKRQGEELRAARRSPSEAEALRRELGQVRGLLALTGAGCAVALLLALVALRARRRPAAGTGEPVEDRLRAVEARFRALDREG